MKPVMRYPGLKNLKLIIEYIFICLYLCIADWISLQVNLYIVINTICATKCIDRAFPPCFTGSLYFCMLLFKNVVPLSFSLSFELLLVMAVEFPLLSPKKKKMKKKKNKIEIR